MKRLLAQALILLATTQVTHPRALGQTSPATASSSLSLSDRVMMASQIYHIISTFFPNLSQEKFDASYRVYLESILRSDNRRDFDLASMELVATLHDGHSWYYDTWLDRPRPNPSASSPIPCKANGPSSARNSIPSTLGR